MDRANVTPPRFFRNAAAFRRWLEKNHDRAGELLVGFYKVGSGRPSMTWPESVDEALAFGWIDGVRRRIDDASYSIRFTPRRRGSIWSAINSRRIAELEKLGRMHEAGRQAFARRDEKKSAIYSYENRPKSLPPEFEKKFRANAKAWRYFNEQRPSYRRVAIHWVMSAKKEETRERRLKTLIEDSANGLWIRIATLERRS